MLETLLNLLLLSTKVRSNSVKQVVNPKKIIISEIVSFNSESESNKFCSDLKKLGLKK